MENRKPTLKEHIENYMENRKKVKDTEEDKVLMEEEVIEEKESTIEEIEQRVKEAAENMEDIAELLEIPVSVCGVNHSLVNGLNCNITPVPILNVAIVSNIGLNIVDINIKPEMETMLELILDIIVKSDENQSYYRFSLADLYSVGLVTVVESITKEIELTPIEFRGLTVEMYLDELPMFAEKNMNINKLSLLRFLSNHTINFR